MPASLEHQQLEESAIAHLRGAENPFASSVATLEDGPLYDVPELLAEQRADIKAFINLYRQANRASQVVPIIGDRGSGKTHLLGSLRRDLDNDQQLLVVSEGFPKGRDAADFFLWQIVSRLRGHKKSSTPVLARLCERVTARLLGETLRRLSPGRRLQLTEANGFWQGLGRKLGIAGVVDPSLQIVEQLLEVSESNRLADRLSAFWDIGVRRDQVLRAIHEHLWSSESSDADGYLRKMIYSGMVNATLLHRQDDLEDFLTDGFRGVPEHVAGAGDLTKRLLRVLLEVFAAFHTPVVVAFDQLEDFLRSGSAEEQKELRDNFTLGLVALTNSVPNLCFLLFAERGLWNEVLQRLDPFSADRLYRDISIPGKPNQRAIHLPDHLNANALIALVQARTRPCLMGFDQANLLPPGFPFTEAHLATVQREATARNCLKQLGEIYSKVVYSKAEDGPTSAEIHENLMHSWDHHLGNVTGPIENQSTADIPTLTDNLKGLLDYWVDRQLASSIPWACNDVLQHGHDLFGYLNVLRTRSGLPGLGIGFWLGERASRPTDLDAKIAFFNGKSPAICRLVVLRRDGEGALTGASADTFNRARKKGRDVRIEELLDNDLAVVWCFPLWLKAANAYIQSLPDKKQEVGREALNDITRERTRSLFDKISKWLADAEEEEAPA
jgi:hypothetical protein